MLHTQAGIANGARDNTIAACNMNDLITTTWTTDLRQAGATWSGTVSHVVGHAGARTGITVDFGVYGHFIMPFTNPSIRVHALTRSVVADPHDAAITAVEGGKGAVSFEPRDPPVCRHTISSHDFVMNLDKNI